MQHTSGRAVEIAYFAYIYYTIESILVNAKCCTNYNRQRDIQTILEIQTEMDSKRNGYVVSIRRQSRNSVMASLRSLQQQNSTPSLQEYHAYLQTIDISKLQLHVGSLKLYAPLKQVSSDMRKGWSQLWQMLINSQSIVKSLGQTKVSHTQWCTDLVSILIQISSHFTIQLEQFPFNPFESITVQYFSHDSNSAVTTSLYWLFANILLRGNKTAHSLINCLYHNGIPQYIKRRCEGKFQAGQLAVFAYFVGGVIGNADGVEGGFDYSAFKGVIHAAEEILSCDDEDATLYMLEGIVLHAPHIAKHQYQLFCSKSFGQLFQFICKNKKSKLIIKYLSIVLEFIRAEISSSSKMDVSYNRIGKFKIIGNLQYCIQNRSPQVKRMLLEICTLLLEGYFQQIDFQRQIMYTQLVKQANLIDKFADPTLIAFLQYLACFAFNIIASKQDLASFIQNINQFSIPYHLSQLLLAYPPKQSMIVDGVLRLACIMIEEGGSQMIDVWRPMKKAVQTHANIMGPKEQNIRQLEEYLLHAFNSQ